MTKEKKPVSLEDLNLTSACDVAKTINMDDVPMFKGKGITIDVVGRYSQRVRDFASKEVNKMRAESANKRSHDGFKPVQEDIEYFRADAAVRVVGWSGISVECTFENVKQLCAINAEAQAKIVEASNELSNFTQSK